MCACDEREHGLSASILRKQLRDGCGLPWLWRILRNAQFGVPVPCKLLCNDRWKLRFLWPRRFALPVPRWDFLRILVRINLRERYTSSHSGQWPPFWQLAYMYTDVVAMATSHVELFSMALKASPKIRRKLRMLSGISIAMSHAEWFSCCCIFFRKKHFKKGIYSHVCFFTHIFNAHVRIYMTVMIVCVYMHACTHVYVWDCVCACVCLQRLSHTLQLTHNTDMCLRWAARCW